MFEISHKIGEIVNKCWFVWFYGRWRMNSTWAWRNWQEIWEYDWCSLCRGCRRL